jgi:DNA-binding NtrC family response regulator
MGKKVAGVSREAMPLLQGAAWKGNIRELDNALQRAVILGDGPLVTPVDLPPDLAPAADDPSAVEPLDEAVRRFEKRHIERLLLLAPDKKEAARRLDIGLSSLYRKIEQYGIASAEGGK